MVENNTFFFIANEMQLVVLKNGLKILTYFFFFAVMFFLVCFFYFYSWFKEKVNNNM